MASDHPVALCRQNLVINFVNKYVFLQLVVNGNILCLVWGDETSTAGVTDDGFGVEGDGFDSFLSMGPPAVIERSDSHDSDDDAKEFNVVIKPKDGGAALGFATPILAPPPRSSQNNSIYSGGKYYYTHFLYYKCL